MEQEKTSPNIMNRLKVNFLDAAVFLALATGLLYYFGYEYWSEYFRYFGIPAIFIDLSFEHVLVSSSLTTLFLLLMLLFWIHWNTLKSPIEQVSLGIGELLFIFTMLIFGLVEKYHWPLVAYLAILLSAITAYFFLTSRPGLRRVTIESFFRKPVYTVLLAIIAIFLLALVYGIQGYTDAYATSRGKRGARMIKITTRDTPHSQLSGILVSYVQEKYVICQRVRDKNENPKVTLIERDNVLTAEITDIPSSDSPSIENNKMKRPPD